VPKQKKPKKSKSKVKRKPKVELSPINLVFQQLFSIILIVLGIFIWIHQYIDTEQGLVGLLIETVTLEGFGILGFLILPFCLVGSGLLAAFAKKSLWFHFIVSVVSYVGIHQWIALVINLSNPLLLRDIGYVGLAINKFNLIVFGNIGALVIYAVTVLTLNTYSIGWPIFKIFKPFKWIPLSLNAVNSWLFGFMKNTIIEYRKNRKGKSFQVWLIHTLFFIKLSPTNPIKAKKPLKPETKDLIARTMALPKAGSLSKGKSDVSLSNPSNSFNFDDIEMQEHSDNKKNKEGINQEIDNLNRLKALATVEEPDETIVEKQIEEKKPKQFIDSSFLKEETSMEKVPLKEFQCPPMELLEKGTKPKHSLKSQTKQRVEKAAILEETLASFNVAAKVINITPGPTVTRYELQPGDGVKISKITSLSKDISLKLAAPDIRIEAPIPGKALIGIEVPNQDVQMITLRSIIEESSVFNLADRLIAGLGKTITGESIIMNLGKMPHVLIAGATGSGKSVCINSIILSILMRSTPSEVKFLMIDPKKVELSFYEGIPHLLAPVVTNPNKAAATLKKWALVEMENRYELFSRVGVKDIAGFNAYVERELKKNPEATILDDNLALEKLPYIVVIIDELADLMMVASQDVEQTICRLAQMARATGIHLVIATQRPSVNVVTGLIKANIPSRVSFYLQSQIDSRTIIDMAGAEKLLGKGDMLYFPVGSFNPSRAQGVFVSEAEVKRVVTWLKGQGKPDYLNEIINVEPLENTQESSKKNATNQDELYENAKQLVMSTKYASTSYLQRKLRIGYNRAARIMDELEEEGVISEYVGEKKSRSVK
tara:strand:+ start:18231 stop:20714 length:2484 start_codon:yes stop_codon:yes gene_type:complete